MKMALVVLLGLALLWALLAWRALRIEAQIEADFPPEGSLIEVNGSQMHYVELGQGPDLVLIHGSNGSTRDMTFSLVQRMAEHYRVLVIDRPGLGFSLQRDPQGDSIKDQARQIADTAARLGADKPIVMGHSYGGAVALAWAVYSPERLSALVLAASPSHPWSTPLERLYRLGSNPVFGPIVLPLLPALITEARLERELTAVFKPDPVPAGYFEHFGPQLSLRSRSMYATAHQRANLLHEIQKMEPLYGKIIQPVEIVHGTADITVGLSIHSEPLVGDVKTAELTPLQGKGHMIQHSSEGEIEEAIHRAAVRAGLRPET